ASATAGGAGLVALQRTRAGGTGLAYAFPARWRAALPAHRASLRLLRLSACHRCGGAQLARGASAPARAAYLGLARRLADVPRPQERRVGGSPAAGHAHARTAAARGAGALYRRQALVRCQGQAYRARGAAHPRRVADALWQLAADSGGCEAARRGATD